MCLRQNHQTDHNKHSCQNLDKGTHLSMSIVLACHGGLRNADFQVSRAQSYENRVSNATLVLKIFNVTGVGSSPHGRFVSSRPRNVEGNGSIRILKRISSCFGRGMRRLNTSENPSGPSSNLRADLSASRDMLELLILALFGRNPCIRRSRTRC